MDKAHYTGVNQSRSLYNLNTDNIGDTCLA
jgi:hypothetical protein